MQPGTPEHTDLTQAVMMALRDVLGNALLAVYLHGSAVSGGLRPQSDIDLLAIVDESMTDDQRSDLLAALLPISGRHPVTPDGLRCIEAIVFCRSDLLEGRFPARAEFVYGEWLRDGFEAGVRPMPASDPEYTLLLAQARGQAIPLFGPGILTFLPEIPRAHVRQAMRDALPDLLNGLRGDERNVLLTLARMWRTARTGEFVAKDAAAEWAIPQMSHHDAATLDYARRAYLGELVDEWRSRSGEARRLSESLRARVIESS